MHQETYLLTAYSKAAGCGCKIAPAVLQEILSSDFKGKQDPNLLVGYASNDDAAVYRINNEECLISTTDFFAPVVDDAYDYGRIAAANAISDIYAMGGSPLLALAILGWPVDQLPASLAKRVMEGAREICEEAGIPLAGGHSIDAREPFFGLSVNGKVSQDRLKKNNTAREGDLLFITKPIGVGILTTAEKRQLLLPEHKGIAVRQMIALNRIGEALSSIPGVHAMTDITGFGLLGHLIEMAEGSGQSVKLNYTSIPILEAVKYYLSQRIIPDATYRNWNFYQPKVRFETGVNVMEAFQLLPDPQTNGGILFSCDSASVERVQLLLREFHYAAHTNPIGEMIPKESAVVAVYS